MAFPHPRRLPLIVPPLSFDETRARMRSDIADMRHSVFASRRNISDAYEAIARADQVLLRQISDPRQVTLHRR